MDEHNVLFIWNMKLDGVNISSTYWNWNVSSKAGATLTKYSLWHFPHFSKQFYQLSLHKESGECVMRLPNPPRTSPEAVPVAWHISSLVLGKSYPNQTQIMPTISCFLSMMGAWDVDTRVKHRPGGCTHIPVLSPGTEGEHSTNLSSKAGSQRLL